MHFAMLGVNLNFTDATNPAQRGIGQVNRHAPDPFAIDAHDQFRIVSQQQVTDLFQHKHIDFLPGNESRDGRFWRLKALFKPGG